MAKDLIIVESPKKAKTLSKFLGSKFDIEASVGHVRDLPEKGFGVDLEELAKGKFEIEYVNIPDKTAVIKKLRDKAKKARTIYLAPDPDREGEAIAWHLSEILLNDEKLKKGEKSKLDIQRITFNAFTQSTVNEALANPTKIDQLKVDSQQARRLLDRIVGFKLSPIVNNKVIRRTKGVSSISAGRVQSVALKLVVDREKEIEAFIPEEYWNINPLLETAKEKNAFAAQLYTVDGKRVLKPQDREKNKDALVISNKKEADKVVEKLKKAKYTTGLIEKSEKKRNPVPPFITSTLQQEAYRYYKFDAKRTMGIAQSLYEGVDIGDGPEGLITYMRTDSTRISKEGLDDARDYILKTYGPENLPDQPRIFKTKKASQDAHEAIRPASISKKHSPKAISKYLDDDQRKLYELIWCRFIACQMNPAISDTISCTIETDQNITLRATGSAVKFPGFLAVYEEKRDHSDEEEKEALLPFLKEGQALNLKSLLPEQSFTKPPPRFTEASLVKELELHEIGRPSTYAAIMNKIQSREFTTKKAGALVPTPLGMATASFLETNFPVIMDIQFTAGMEGALDLIEEGDRKWKTVMTAFYKDFEPEIEKAADAQVPKVATAQVCPKCGSLLEKTWSKDKRKYFLGCTTYPTCDYTVDEAVQNLDKGEYAEDFNWSQSCPSCKAEMKLRIGKYGPFLACSNYPTCTELVNIPKKGEKPIEQIELIKCIAVGCDGEIRVKRSGRGHFYGCSNYPKCDVAGNSVEEIFQKYGKTHKQTAYVKPKRKGKNILYKLSPALIEVVKAEELTRPELTKALWVYIKKQDLQDPDNRRQIILDAKLKAAFGTKRKSIDMFEMATLMGPQLRK